MFVYSYGVGCPRFDSRRMQQFPLLNVAQIGVEINLALCPISAMGRFLVVKASSSCGRIFTVI
jgi:hypothetical protein